MKPSNNRHLFIFLALILLTLACAVVVDLTGNGDTPAPTQPATAPTDSEPTSLVEPPPTYTETSPPPTQEQQASPPPKGDDLLEHLIPLVNSERWAAMEISMEMRQRWVDIANGMAVPTEEERAEIIRLTSRLEMIDALIESKAFPKGGSPAVRWLYPDDPDTAPLPYLVDANAEHPDQAEQLYLWVRDGEGEIIALLPAPWVEGLLQRLSPDGEYVEYYPPDKEWIIKADARRLDPQARTQKYLLEMLKENDLPLDYAKDKIYPRFYFNMPHIYSAFYGVGQLTFNQVLLLESVLELYTRPEMQELAEYVFVGGEQVNYIVSRVPHTYAAAMARPLGGSPKQGIVVLYTKNLFNNRYDTASSIAHEAAHIWQGPPASCNDPEARLKAEIGNGKISAEFYSWSAEDLYKAIRRGEAGAYHASLWVLLKFNQTDYIEWTKSIILTGTANGQSIINCP